MRTGGHGDDDAAPLNGVACALTVEARVAVEGAGAVAVATRSAHHEQARRAHRLLESRDAHEVEHWVHRLHASTAERYE